MQATQLKRITKPSLVDLLAHDNWLELEPAHGGRLANAWDKVAVSFLPSKGKGTPTDQVKIVIGKNVMEQIGWEIGDKVCVYHNPDYLQQIKLVKADTKTGFKITKINNSKNGIVSFRWKQPVALTEDRNKSVEYIVFKKILLIDLNEEKKD